MTGDCFQGKKWIYDFDNVYRCAFLPATTCSNLLQIPRTDHLMRVLIIEDSSVLTRLIETCFRDSDFEFETQRLPYSPQRIGGFEEADMVVIGIYQPFAVALGIIQRLRERHKPPAIIALTTDTRESSVATITAAGADVVIRMPFRPDDLRSAAAEALGNRLDP